MHTKNHYLTFALLTVLACDAEPEATATKSSASEAEPGKDEAKDEAKDDAKDDDPDEVRRWSASYTGALTGEIGGDFIIVARTGITAVIKARGDGGKLSITLNRSPGTEPPKYSVLPMSLELADGTKCKISEEPSVTVEAAEKEALEIEVSGELSCGEDRTISVTAKVEKRD